MQSLLSRATKLDVITDPFPHIIIKDALEEELYLKLVSELPSIPTISRGIENQGIDLSASNVRLHYLAKDIFNDRQVSSLWKEFIALHTSDTFLDEFFYLFKEHIIQIYPDFEAKYGCFDNLSSGVRKFASFKTADVLLDALISVNTPVTTKPSSVRRAHIDLPDKLFAGLFYMRHPQDDSTGGDLEIYRFKHGKPGGFKTCEVADTYVEYIKTVKYERNVLVLFLNSLHSLHGVTVRSITPYPRYFVNLVGEVETPLFNPFKYQEATHVRYLKKFQKVMQKLAV